MVLVSVKESYRSIVSICDEDLLGKYFEDGKMQLDIKKDFYSGESKSIEDVIELLKDLKKADSTFNIVGKESIDAGLKAGVISKLGVMKLKGVPFALSLL